MASSPSGPEIFLVIHCGGKLHRLGPQIPYDLPESELDFEGKRLLTVEGLVEGTFQLTTRTGTIDQTEQGPAWSPFSSGDRVFGRIEIECTAPEGRFTFLIELCPSRLTTAHWRTLVRHLRSVSDGLLTSFFSGSNVRVPTTQVGARRINGGVMFAQLQDQMSGFLSSVAAIARNPRRDFKPGLPKLGHSPDAPSPEVYENAIIWLSVDAVLETLRQTQRSCQEEYNELSMELTLFKKGGGYETRSAKLGSLEKARLQLREWHVRLSDLARQLPAEKVARGLRGTPPHVSVRLQGNAHYVRVVRFAMRVGRERVLEAESRWRSSLSSRRSSTLFEFWALFSLLRAFGALGYGSVNVDFRTFLKSEPFDTMPKPNTEFLLRHEQRKETIALHYEVLARSVATKRKRGTSAEWHEELTAAHAEGFVGKNLAWTPDFWLELRRDDGAVVAAVGDAIFTDQVDGDFGITKKANKVADYVKNVVRARRSQPLIKAYEVGFVIHCNNKPIDLAKLVAGDHVFLSFVPQLAEGPTEEDPADAFVVSPETLKDLGEYLEELRSAMGPFSTEG